MKRSELWSKLRKRSTKMKMKIIIIINRKKAILKIFSNLSQKTTKMKFLKNSFSSK